ncbi:MAG: metallophosphoesterase family protein [Planctomycetaceae bacterium]
MTERTIAIGDIHGCGTALETLLSALELTENDRLVLLGDIVDRGPQTRQVIELLLQLKSDGQEIILIRGNHEEMLLDALRGGSLSQMWQTYGGQDVLDSYELANVKDIPEDHLKFLQSSINYWENDSDIFVHANLHPQRSLADQFPQYLRWQRFTGQEAPHCSGKRVIVGHTPCGMDSLTSGTSG